MAKIKMKFGKADPAKITTFGLASKRKGNPDTHGGKGAGLIDMAREGLPVPPGFVIHTKHCLEYRKDPEKTMKRVMVTVKQGLKLLQKPHPGAGFYLSVRSGAKVSMPGMMDTILNVGSFLTVVKKPHLAFKLDCQRRFLQMYGEVVMGLDPKWFQDELTYQREVADVEFDWQLPALEQASLVSKFCHHIEKDMKIPETLEEQLDLCIEAVFQSWDNPRAIEYRNLNGISHDQGTAVIIQLMVYGNQPNSGSGVAFSRDPSTGEAAVVGEFLENAQGEEVVSGTRTPMGFAEMHTKHPEWAMEVADMAENLEAFTGDMVDIEFTIANGKLWVLQMRPGKRTGIAAFRIAHDLSLDLDITDEEAVALLKPEHLSALHTPSFAITPPYAWKGKPASPGVAIGLPTTLSVTADEYIAQGTPFIWVAHETNPNHIKYMAKAEGIITEVGGITSHAAVVARGMDKPCITACEGLLNGPGKLAQGLLVYMDASTGEVGQADPLVGPASIPQIVQGSTDDVRVQVMMAMAYKLRGAIPEVTLWTGGPARINAGNWMLDPKGGKSGLTLSNLKTIAESDGPLENVILNISAPAPPAEDEMLSGLFSGDSTGEVARRKTKIIGWLLKNPVEGLYIEQDEPFTAMVRHSLQAKGYKIVETVETLKDAQMADGFVTLAPALIKALGYPLDCLAEGFDIKLVPPKMSPEDVLRGD